MIPSVTTHGIDFKGVSFLFKNPLVEVAVPMGDQPSCSFLASVNPHRILCSKVSVSAVALSDSPANMIPAVKFFR